MSIFSKIFQLAEVTIFKIVLKNIEYSYPNENIEAGDRHLEADLDPHANDFTLYITNKTDEYLQYVALHLELTTEDERHKYYSRRPLYRPGYEHKSKAFGMSDTVEPRENAVEFRVNTKSTVPHDVDGYYSWDSNPYPLIEDRVRERQENLYILSYIAYRFQGGSERHHFLFDQSKRIRVAPAIKHQSLNDILEDIVEYKPNTLTQHELDAIQRGSVNGDEGGIVLGLLGRHFPKKSPSYWGE